LQIRVKLMGIFRSRTPADNMLDLPDGATIEDALVALNIPATHVHLVMVNGEHQRDSTRPLSSDDEFLVMPPVAGG